MEIFTRWQTGGCGTLSGGRVEARGHSSYEGREVTTRSCTSPDFVSKTAVADAFPCLANHLVRACRSSAGASRIGEWAAAAHCIYARHTPRPAPARLSKLARIAVSGVVHAVCPTPHREGFLSPHLTKCHLHLCLHAAKPFTRARVTVVHTATHTPAVIHDRTGAVGHQAP